MAQSAVPRRWGCQRWSPRKAIRRCPWSIRCWVATAAEATLSVSHRRRRRRRTGGRSTNDERASRPALVQQVALVGPVGYHDQPVDPPARERRHQLPLPLGVVVDAPGRETTTVGRGRRSPPPGGGPPRTGCRRRPGSARWSRPPLARRRLPAPWLGRKPRARWPAPPAGRVARDPRLVVDDPRDGLQTDPGEGRDVPHRGPAAGGLWWRR